MALILDSYWYSWVCTELTCNLNDSLCWLFELAWILTLKSWVWLNMSCLLIIWLDTRTNKLTCFVGGGRVSKEDGKSAKLTCSVLSFPMPTFSLTWIFFNDQSYIKPPEHRTLWWKRLHSCNSYFTNGLLLMNHKNNMAKCADFCSFPLFCWN